jgi:hypothetical protein
MARYPAQEQQGGAQVKEERREKEERGERGKE